MLCEICRIVIQTKKGARTDNEGVEICPHHTTGDSLQKSAADGCHICSAVWNQLAPCQHKYLLELEAKYSITNFSFITPKEVAEAAESSLVTEIYHLDALMLLVDFNLNKKVWDLPGGVGESMKLFGFQPSEALNKFTLSKPSGDSTASDESWSLVKQWLETCESQHSLCTDKGVTVPWYPTRLIDIGESSIANPRLVLSSESSLDGPYVTLSHCWGSARSLQLTLSRLADLQQLIPVSDLPRTFKQSFEITRRLGFRYIWIDSLCIIQDSKDDWLFEAACMHEVYSHSYCTIAATASADSHQGLFRHRATQFLYPSEIEIPWLSGTGKYQLIDYDFWSSQIQDQPLHRRGWVVQERLLSRRVLHFSSQQLVWECRELDAAEKYPGGLPMVLATSGGALFKGLDPQKDGARIRRISEEDPHPKFYIYEIWNKIVKAYSRSLLTFGDDKLIALSGIAKRQQLEMNDQYIAGLWLKLLPSQLLWSIRGCRQIDNTPSVRPEKYRAPSFSWASVDGVLSLGTPAETGFIIEITEIYINPVTYDSTGLVDQGYLRIRGVLKELRLTINHETPLRHSWLMTVNGVRIQTPKKPLVDLDVDDIDLTGMKYCMPVRAPDKYNKSLIGLILETTGYASGRFRRIGLFTALDQTLHPMILARHENESKLPCEIFDEVTQTHTICII